MNVVDSSGWIEFFKAGANGPVVRLVTSFDMVEADIDGFRCDVAMRVPTWDILSMATMPSMAKRC